MRRIRQSSNSITTLNVAGPIASESPQVYAYALQAMDYFLKDQDEKQYDMI